MGAQWEDDVRDVVAPEHGLARFAAVVAGSVDGGRAALVAALAGVFRHGSPLAPARRDRRGVGVRTDDVDALAVDPVRRAVVTFGERLGNGPWCHPALRDVPPRVRAALVLRADGRDASSAAWALDATADDVRAWWASGDAQLAAAGTTAAVVLREGGAVDVTGVVAAVAEHVRDERRRTRTRVAQVLGIAAALLLVVGGAVALGTETGGGSPGTAAAVPAPGQAAASPSAEEAVHDRVSVDCGDRVAVDPEIGVDTRLTVTTDTSRIVSWGTWYGEYTLAEDSLTPHQQALLDPAAMDVDVLLTSGGVVVAHGETVAGRPDVPYADFAVSDMPLAVAFSPCGDTLDDDAYDVVVVGESLDRQHWLVSDGLPLTVLPQQPTGYQPPWLEDSELACGETVEDFEARVGGNTQSALTLSEVALTDTGLDYAYVNDSRKPVEVALPRQMAVAWVQDGMIVGVGADEQSPVTHRTVGRGKEVRLTATWDTVDHCRPGKGGTFASHLRAGDYQVVVYGRFWGPDGGDAGGGTAGWAIPGSGVADVVVARDGSVRVR